MATRNAKNEPTAKDEPARTTLDEHTDAPSVTAPGDGPADTTDPAEIAVSVSPDKATAAAAGHGTVNAVIPVGRTDEKRDDEGGAKHRVETFERRRPDGKVVKVTHNIDTGESKAEPVES